MPIQIPDPLLELLERSGYDGPIRLLCNHVEQVVAQHSGGCYFFPHFTDHGPQHIQDVLQSEMDLIPSEVLHGKPDGRRPTQGSLADADAAVLIGGTLLHDIAMHLQLDGFRELISKDSRFKPIPWFDQAREGHAGDRPWHELWSDFEREARKLTDRELTEIIGEQQAQIWKFEGLPASPGAWQENHRLIVGEFIRRHHPRLAHEIALYGFPGLQPSAFPAMGDGGHALHEIADLIGLVARSHGVSLRLCKEYLDKNPDYQGSPRPKGTAVLYPMALLRVADYLQIDKRRAPAVLLNLGKPQSPISIREWVSHQAIKDIEEHDDPRALMVRVSQKVSLPVFLHLQDLVVGIQREIDHSTAVLDECYGARPEGNLKNLGLNIRRVRSNLHEAQFRDNLPYIPRRISFSTEPKILSILVEPLYGAYPGVGVRELIQNAIDAVRELRAWNQSRGLRQDGPEEDDGWDVLVEFIQQSDSSWRLRLKDRGIGMTPDTLENYFLRAGASFRDSPNWRRDFVDDAGQPRLARSGKFGIGVFAAFLLGDSIKVQTRHAGSQGVSGHSLEAAHHTQLIEVKREPALPVGTTVEIPISPDAAMLLGLDHVSATEFSRFHSQVDWYCGTWPRLRMCVVEEGGLIEMPSSATIPDPNHDFPPEWSIIRPEGFPAVMWTFGKAPRIACNGIKIADPGSDMTYAWHSWTRPTPFAEPCVAVVDAHSALPLNTTRYKFTRDLTFLEALERDVILSFIAHALVCGPTSIEEALNQDRLHPLVLDLDHGYPSQKTSSRVRDFYKSAHDAKLWCCRKDGFVPLDPWLCAQCGSRSVLVYGNYDFSVVGEGSTSKQAWAEEVQDTAVHAAGISPWYSAWWGGRSKPKYMTYSYEFRILEKLRLGWGGLFESIGIAASYTSDWDYMFGDSDADKYFSRWDIIPWDQQRDRYCASYCTGKGSSAMLIALLKSTEARHVSKRHLCNSDAVASQELSKQRRRLYLDAFVAALEFYDEPQPNSHFARTWNEVLGPRLIPFDPTSRAALVNEGRRHPELKAHIERWEKMKAANSEWVRGELLEPPRRARPGA
jgi:hypothetical protein